MIALLRGTLLEKHPNQAIVEAGGVGYDVAIPVSTFTQLPEPGAEVRLRIHTHVREDALQLFGFATPLELALFDRLVAVSGIGPKLALAVLSGIAPGDLVGAIGGGDIARLVSIPGIGRKTAERIVLELRDKVSALEGSATGGAPGDGTRTDLLSALVNLGYHRPAAEKAVDAALAATGGAFEASLRRALESLTRGGRK
jgi:Holliday junction DNA helicase RuvA